MGAKIEKHGIKLPFEVNKDEIYVQEVKGIGNAGHVGFLKKYIGWKVIVIPYKPPKK